MRLVAVLLLLLAAPASAGPCEVVGGDDLVRASIAAGDCDDAAAVAALERRASRAGYSPVEVVTRPAGATVVVEPAPDAPFTAPRKVWLPPGRHTVTALVDGQPIASTIVVARDGDRAAALLELPAPPEPAADGVVDFGEEGGGEMSSGPPPKQEFPSLLREEFRRGVDAEGGALVDVRPRAYPWRIAAGAAVGELGAGGAVALERRFALGPRLALTPSAAAAAYRDATQLGGALLVEVTGRLAGRWHGAAGAGPGYAHTFAVDDGGAFEAVVGVELRRGAVAVAARGALGRAPSLALLLGLRW